MPRPLFVSVNGTGVPDPFGPGFSADIGRALANPWNYLVGEFWGSPAERLYNVFDWQPIGYPAAVTPMGPSVLKGRAEVNLQISRRPLGTPLFLSGYSQGAIVTGQVWAYDILDPKGLHHDRLKDVHGIIQFGDPLRCPGIAHGNEVAGFPAPTNRDGQMTGGIAGPADLTAAQTPDFLLSCALDGDLYAACPVGSNPWGKSIFGGSKESDVGRVETNIYNIIQKTSVMNIFSIAKDIFAPIGSVQAIVNGLTFASAGMNAPHWQYAPFVPPMVGWLLERGRAFS